ncbi:hypothetical protein EV401DRAFT_2022079 [Pisolithus croceorrhizus]|nr:hypothetical protein EV401DRAFT_2022079 [Pisolithus croceorrhizus]
MRDHFDWLQRLCFRVSCPGILVHSFYMLYIRFLSTYNRMLQHHNDLVAVLLGLEPSMQHFVWHVSIVARFGKSHHACMSSLPLIAMPACPLHHRHSPCILDLTVRTVECFDSLSCTQGRHCSTSLTFLWVTAPSAVPPGLALCREACSRPYPLQSTQVKRIRP